MANKVYSYYKDLPQWAKGVVVVGGLVVVYLAYRGISKQFKKNVELKDAKDSVNNATNEIKQEIQSGVKPSYASSQYDGWAEAIVKQFKGADLLLESYPTIKNIFDKLKNNADYLMLKKSFGIRTYDDAFFGQVKNVTLESAIQDELTTGSIEKLNAILEKKGITYRV